MKHKILIIEDDPVIQSELRTLLNANGYEAETAGEFTGIPELVQVFEPHLILLDIMLPGVSGFSLCSQIRSLCPVPIIFVTSSDTEMDEINSIVAGGDAFITKPYNTVLLLAKIASLLKRAYPLKQEASQSWQGAVLRLDRSAIEYEGRSAELTKNEVKILHYLFDHAGRICARADIIEYLWDNRLYIDDNALSVNINRIREKLSAIGLDSFIRTKHRQGYLI